MRMIRRKSHTTTLLSRALLIAALLVAAAAAVPSNLEAVELLADVRVPASLAMSPAVRWAPPMAARTVLNGTASVVGTDDRACSQRDALQRHVSASPTASFLEFRFNVSTPGNVLLDVDSFAEDSLANSFWFQLDSAIGTPAEAVELETSATAVMTTRLELPHPSTGAASACVAIATAGEHSARFYVREVGAAISRLRVSRAAPPAVDVSQSAPCNPCVRDTSSNTLRLAVPNLCGAHQLHPTFVRVNGRVCKAPYVAEATNASTAAVVVCMLDPATLENVAADATSTNAEVVLVAPDEALYSTATMTLPVKASPENTMAAWLVAVIVVLVAVALAAGGALAAAARLRHAGARDTANAPRAAPVALVFTDIEDSTALWANHTLAMAAALDTHHDVVRRAVARHGGYEVKTVGDAFMVAAGSAEAALLIARDVQVELHAQRWPRCVTRHYEGELLDDEPGLLEAAAPGAAFHGPRVRIGVHVGAPEVVFDEISKGYDYYGPDVNVAARTEAAARGGQVLVSAAVVTALQDGSADVPGVYAAHERRQQLKGLGTVSLSELVIETLPVRRMFASTPSLAAAAEEAQATPFEGADTPPETISRDVVLRPEQQVAHVRGVARRIARTQVLDGFDVSTNARSTEAGGSSANKSPSTLMLEVGPSAGAGNAASLDRTASTLRNTAGHSQTHSESGSDRAGGVVLDAATRAVQQRLATLGAVFKPFPESERRQLLQRMVAAWRTSVAVSTESPHFELFALLALIERSHPAEAAMYSHAPRSGRKHSLALGALRKLPSFLSAAPAMQTSVNSRGRVSFDVASRPTSAADQHGDGGSPLGYLSRTGVIAGVTDGMTASQCADLIVVDEIAARRPSNDAEAKASSAAEAV